MIKIPCKIVICAIKSILSKTFMKHNYILLAFVLAFANCVFAQDMSKFRQLGTELPTPNTYRTASGAPGHQYWQQKADYDIDVELDDDKQQIRASEKITYTNNSPDVLHYLWLQLDQNIRQKGADSYGSATSTMQEKMSANGLRNILNYDNDYGYKILAVKDLAGKTLPYTINKTMMRVDLATPLRSGQSFSFQVSWSYNIVDRLIYADRGGLELFEDGNYLYTITQWFPRMAVYNDTDGWQHKQFLGSGEFTLPFGDYRVKITVPADHIVASTGVLQNPKDVLTDKQSQLFEQSKTAKKPVIIVSQAEATEKEKTKATTKKTWIYSAQNVRDFAFGSSRKYIWDAMGVEIGGKTVMAMSYYPKEANPLYEKYSTEAVAHTLKVYSKYTIDYPYPVAISVEAANGMEYPMICFNYGRPEKDGTYSDRVKYGMLGVVIHEVGHNFFPMIINSDERQWTWMDEGLNSFLEVLAEKEWERTFPANRYEPSNIVGYMKGDKSRLEPIMTNSESIRQFGNNAYAKPAIGLNILRETIMGRELFDFAFKQYAKRWAFKHPTPADFFRTMEDASAVDLDWFWRGWFYTTDFVDISLEEVKAFELDSKDPEVEKPKQKKVRDSKTPYIAYPRNKAFPTLVEQKPELNDFYNTYDPLDVTNADKENYKQYQASLGEVERNMIAKSPFFYELAFKNIGGLIMPIILEFEFEDGTKEVKRLPAEIWKLDNEKVSKVFGFEKKVKNILLDPFIETADTNVENNYFPRRQIPSRFEIFKSGQGPRAISAPNPMQQAIKK